MQHTGPLSIGIGLWALSRSFNYLVCLKNITFSLSWSVHTHRSATNRPLLGRFVMKSITKFNLVHSTEKSCLRRDLITSHGRFLICENTIAFCHRISLLLISHQHSSVLWEAGQPENHSCPAPLTNPQNQPFRGFHGFFSLELQINRRPVTLHPY